MKKSTKIVLLVVWLMTCVGTFVLGNINGYSGCKNLVEMGHIP